MLNTVFYGDFFPFCSDRWWKLFFPFSSTLHYCPDLYLWVLGSNFSALSSSFKAQMNYPSAAADQHHKANCHSAHLINDHRKNIPEDKFSNDRKVKSLLHLNVTIICVNDLHILPYLEEKANLWHMLGVRICL